jgi:sensor c-di-GMP phosphodiesterase-like protein
MALDVVAEGVEVQEQLKIWQIRNVTKYKEFI